jgi:hypothetical protein
VWVAVPVPSFALPVDALIFRMKPKAIAVFVTDAGIHADLKYSHFILQVIIHVKSRPSAGDKEFIINSPISLSNKNYLVA